MHNRGWAVAASAVALVFACDGSITVPRCPSLPLTVSVTASANPTFSWTPNCVAEALIVYEVRQPSVGPDLTVWIVAARTRGIGALSPVAYGQRPFTMRQTTDPLPLVAGRTYRVSILNTYRVEMGSRLFTP